MIKNEREYKITKASFAKFADALKHIAKLRKEGAYDPAKLMLQQEAIQSMLDDLKQQLEEYENLKLGGFNPAAFDLVEALPTNLIRARIALGWTQKDLAQQLGTTEQQIQKYESTEYESASLRKIGEIVDVLKTASESNPPPRAVIN